MSSFDLYQTVTDQIVAMLEAGVVPWRSPFLAAARPGIRRISTPASSTAA
jgi:antirestriction protein ArdC